jgi:type IV secretion system protein TrbL
MQRLRSALFWAALASGIAFAIILASVAVLVLSTGSASAAETTSNSLDTIVQRYQQAAQSWESTLKTYAQTLFWLLATIEITLAGIRLVLKGSDFSEWASELVNQILYIGFFAALLQNSTGTNSWASVIVQSFRNAANSAVQGSGGASMMAPSDICA